MMDVAAIAKFSEAELRKALGPELVAKVSVDVAADDDGSEYLDITVQSGDRVPSAEASISAKRLLRHALAAHGELRFPNVVYVLSAEAA